jgi:hypothetical protein
MGRRSLLNEALAVIHAFSPITWQEHVKLHPPQPQEAVPVSLVQQTVRDSLQDVTSLCKDLLCRMSRKINTVKGCDALGDLLRPCCLYFVN